MKWISRLFLLVMLGTLTNCAAIVTGTDQDIKITSSPTGATCALTRNGNRVGSVTSTPATVSVDKSWSDIYITCKKKGHLPETAHLQSEFQPASFGNILIGGLIGLTVDATTGAMRKYPEEQYFVLIPGSFPSADAAHDYFNQLSDLVRRREMIKEGILKPTCLNSGAGNPDCQLLNEEFSDSLKKKLELVEEKRAQALDRVTGHLGPVWQQPTATPAAAQPVQPVQSAPVDDQDPFYNPFLI